MFSLGAITKFIVVFVIVLVEFYTFSSNWSLHAQGATFFKCLAPLARSFLKNLLEMGFFFSFNRNSNNSGEVKQRRVWSMFGWVAVEETAFTSIFMSKYTG
jgi:hypothetical protein